MEIVRRHLDLHGFTNQPDAVGIGLQKADVGVAIDGERVVGVSTSRGSEHLDRGIQGAETTTWVAGSRFNRSRRSLAADHWPDVGDDAAAAQHFAGVQGRDAESDVADVLVGGEIFIGQDESLHQEFLDAPIVKGGGCDSSFAFCSSW